MNETKHGGPAFPVPDIDGGAVQEGMTLRDYFAAKAIAVVNENFAPRSDENDADWTEFVARTAYAVADAMLKAREK